MHKIGEMNGLSMYWVYGQTNDNIRNALVHFWVEQNAITDPQEAWRRSSEVACIVVDSNDRIAAINSIYMDRLSPEGDTYWFYRTFIHPRYRLPGVFSHVALLTFQQLADLHARQRGAQIAGAPVGIVAITENQKFDSPAGVRVMQRLGGLYVGKTIDGLSIWRRTFTGRDAAPDTAPVVSPDTAPQVP